MSRTGVAASLQVYTPGSQHRRHLCKGRAFSPPQDLSRPLYSVDVGLTGLLNSLLPSASECSVVTPKKHPKSARSSGEGAWQTMSDTGRPCARTSSDPEDRSQVAEENVLLVEGQVHKPSKHEEYHQRLSHVNMGRRRETRTSNAFGTRAGWV